MILGIKRIYEKSKVTDGKRVLVDRFWPRGVKKSTANVDLWLKEVAPSNSLRKWFSHDPEKWPEFQNRYKKELASSKAFAELVKMSKDTDVTLLFAAKDEEHNNAVVLNNELKKKL